MLRSASSLVADRRLRYLVVGGWNTLVGYLLGVGLYLTLADRVPVIVIALAANLIAITHAFLTWRHLVFDSRAPWLGEYLRCHAVYGFSSLLGSGLLWLLVDAAGLGIWIAQGLVVLATVIFSWFGHSRFTFATGSRTASR
jgi:putative flippase GtrA